jgi:hypothetical protein
MPVSAATSAAAVAPVTALIAATGVLPVAAYWVPKNPRIAAEIKITIALIDHVLFK